MKELPSFSLLVNSFSKLPGIGTKSAERMAYAVLEMNEEDAKNFSDAIINVKTRINKCPKCGLYKENDLCEVCDDPNRDHKTCVVVTYSRDALAFENVGYNGIFHVLGGSISPSKGVGAEQLEIDHLLLRIKDEGISELIIATNPTLEGETTALFIAKLVEGSEVNVTRLAYGLPMGSSLEFTDSLTLGKALEGRKKI